MQGLPRRFDGALALAAAGGLALLVSLFLDWYQPGLSAIEVFEITDLLLGAAAIGAIVTAFRAMSVEPGYEDPRTDWLAPIGIAAAAVVLWEIVDNPPAVAGNSVEAGAWIGFVGATAIASGALLWGSRMSVVLTLRPREDSEPERVEPVAPLPDRGPDDPATGEEDVEGVEPYEPAARPAAGPEPAAETEVEPRTEQHPVVGDEPRSR